jgi:hypothetical protein
MPAFVDNKGKSAWLRVDELLFYWYDANN